MTLEILKHISPREASLLNDPCIRAKVRLRYLCFPFTRDYCVLLM